MNILRPVPRARIIWITILLITSLTTILAACGADRSASAQPAPTATPEVIATPTSAPSPTTAATPTAAATSDSSTAGGKVVQVKIVENNERYSFDPPSLTISKGTQVVWTNASDAPHTVTSDDNGFTSSDTLSESQTFKMTFNTAGTFSYHCAIHTYMIASITVTG